MAVEFGKQNSVEKLLEKGADKGKEDNQGVGVTPEVHAGYRYYDDIKKFIENFIPVKQEHGGNAKRSASVNKIKAEVGLPKKKSGERQGPSSRSTPDNEDIKEPTAKRAKKTSAVLTVSGCGNEVNIECL